MTNYKDFRCSSDQFKSIEVTFPTTRGSSAIFFISFFCICGSMQYIHMPHLPTRIRGTLQNIWISQVKQVKITSITTQQGSFKKKIKCY